MRALVYLRLRHVPAVDMFVDGVGSNGWLSGHPCFLVAAGCYVLRHVLESLLRLEV